MKRNNSRKKTFLKVFIPLLVVLAAAAAYLSMVPFDLTSYQVPIADKLEEITGSRLISDGIMLRVLPVPYIEVKGVRLLEEGEEVFRARLIKLKVSPFPLILKKILIKKLGIVDWWLLAKRDEKGEIKIYNIYERIRKRKRRVTVRSLDAKGGEVSVIDLAGDRDVNLDIAIDRGRFYRSKSGFSYKVSGGLGPDARVFLTGKGRKRDGALALNGTASLTDLDAAVFNPYIKTKGVSLKGRVSTNLAYTLGKGLRTLSGPVNYKDLVIDWPKKFSKPLPSGTGSASVSLSTREKSLKLTVEKLNASLGEFDIGGRIDVETDRAAGDKGSVKMTLHSTPIPAKKVKDLIPRRLFKGKSARVARDFKAFDGKIAVKELTFEVGLGKPRNRTVKKKPGLITLITTLHEMHFRYPGISGDFSRINGGISIKGGTLFFEDITGRYKTGEIKNFKGEISGLFSRRPAYDISLNVVFKASETLRIIKKLYKVRDSDIRRKLDKTDTFGSTSINMQVKGEMGPRKNRKHSTYSGVISFNGVKLRYPDIPVFFDSINGEIGFDNRALVFKKLFIRDAANSTYTLTGRIRDYRHKKPFFDLKAAGVLQKETLQPFIEGTFLEGVVFEDGFYYTTAVKGQVDSILLTPSIDLTSTQIKYKGVIKKPKNFPITLKGTVRLKKGMTRIERAEIRAGSSVLSLEGYLGRRLKSYRFYMKSRVIKLSDIAVFTPLLKTDASNAGLLTVDMEAFREQGAKGPLYKGGFSLTKGIVSPAFSRSPFKDIDITGKFQGDSAEFRLTKLVAGKSDLQGALRFTSISDRTVSFEVNSRAFYSDDFREKGSEPLKAWLKRITELGLTNGAKNGTGPSHIKPKITGHGTVKIGGGRAFGQAFKDFSLEANIEKEAMYLKPISFVTNGGTVSAASTIYRDHDSELLFDIKASIAGVRLKEFFSSLGVKKEVLTGALNGDIFLTCKRNIKPLARGMDGKVFLKTEKGKMWKFLFLGKVFSVVNILSIDELFKKGLPFRVLSGNFTVKSGVIETNDLFFDSDSVRMSAAGSLDTVESTIDSVLVLHPFVTIDKIITSIPVAGWIIGGNDKSAVNIYYRIKGPLKKPSVRPAPVKTIQEGILGTLQRLLSTPFKMMNMDTENMNGTEKQNGPKKQGKEGAVTQP
ncbi:MAG: hypothetical protein BMS9Abin23_0219 [Thermodesulfobacteriota bacterium]|nr:MAG: hypothetical protein BMS9Abin23_0219 [Thermodesulfobacteriota bacterium]